MQQKNMATHPQIRIQTNVHPVTKQPFRDRLTPVAMQTKHEIACKI